MPSSEIAALCVMDYERGRYRRFVPMPQGDGGADWSMVGLNDGKPWCQRHGAMNKVSPGPNGFWRCLTGLGRCRAGCMEEADYPALEDS